MKKPDGYGCVLKLKGRRRQPYAVRTSEICEYLNISAPFDVPDDVLAKFKSLNLRWRKKESVWSAPLDDTVKKYADALTEKYGYVQSVSFRQKYTYHGYFEKASDAHTFLAEWNSGNVIKEHTNLTDGITFAQMYEKWRAYREGLKNQPTKETWRNYETAYSHLSPLHKKKFTSIKAGDMQEILNRYNDKSKATMACMRVVLRGMYSYARMNKYIEEDRTEFLIYEWTGSDKDMHVPFSADDISALWDNLYKIDYVDLVLIYIYTGMRPSELLNVFTADVHIDERYFTGGMKTDYGRNRTIPIHDKILPLIEKRYNPKEKYLIAEDGWEPMTYDHYYKMIFNPLMKELSLNHKPHDTRHTFASMMDSAGANDVCTKLILGHSMSDNITKGVYTHKTIEELLREVNKI